MRQVRKGVFETSSSSTHSITMCMKVVSLVIMDKTVKGAKNEQLEKI